METINVEFKTKNNFEKERTNLKGKESRQISQDEFTRMLIKNWREKCPNQLNKGGVDKK